MDTQLLLMPEDREARLEREVQSLKEQNERLRKGTFAKINVILKMCSDLKNDHESLKAAMCKNSPIYSERLF